MEQADMISILKRYPASIHNRKMLMGLFHDFFPAERGRVNVLMNAFDLGIVDEIETRSLDGFLQNRLCQRMKDEYGISDTMAKWAVDTWLVCYGNGICKKELLIDIREIQSPVQKFSNDQISEPGIENTSGITLTAAQTKAVKSDKRQVIVIAGPGSGKTRVIVERICYLLKEKGVPEKDIIGLTFTAKAAAEMQRRIGEQHPDSRVNIRTFHSLGLQILRAFAEEAGLADGFEIIDRSGKNTLIRDILGERYIERNQLELYTAEISHIKNGLSSCSTSKLPKIQEVLSDYNQRLHKRNMIDFDDMVGMAVQLLENNETVQAVYSIRFPYILVDEFQDVNEIQLKMLKALTSKETSLFLVGDDDQCIYEWRGSKPGILADYANSTADAELIRLEENFRSEDAIVHLSDLFIGHNKNRIFKRLFPAKRKKAAHSATPSATSYHRFSNAVAQANFIAQEILALSTAQQYKPGDFAILLRASKQGAPIKTALAEAGIDYYEQETDNLRYDEFIQVLTAIANPTKDKSLLRAVNFPTKLIDSFTLKEIQNVISTAESMPISVLFQQLYNQKIEFEESEYFCSRYEMIQKLAAQTDALSAQEIVAQLLSYYKSEPKATRASVVKKLTDIENLLMLLQEHSTANGSSMGFLEGLDFIQLALQDECNSEKAETAVNIMTCHKAKGLEFPVVFIPDVQVGVFPNDYFIETEEKLEEERRLFYVTMTRAMDRLYVTCSADPLAGSSRNAIVKKGFLAEIPNIVVGDQ